MKLNSRGRPFSVSRQGVKSPAPTVRASASISSGSLSGSEICAMRGDTSPKARAHSSRQSSGESAPKLSSSHLSAAASFGALSQISRRSRADSSKKFGLSCFGGRR